MFTSPFDNVHQTQSGNKNNPLVEVTLPNGSTALASLLKDNVVADCAFCKKPANFLVVQQDGTYSFLCGECNQ